MSKSETKPPVKADVEKLQQTKRTYRSILDTIRRLEGGGSGKGKNAYKDAFQPENIALRNRLKELCEKMMFLNPESYGRKAEELLWRKVFYDVIQIVKQNRKQFRPGSALECAYRTHLMSGVGYYHHLINKVQLEFDVDVENIIDWTTVPDTQTHSDKKDAKKSYEPLAKGWAVNACHHCLVYLGDLARYQQDLDGYRSTVLAERYYHQAIVWDPDMGMPHNQLGTLSGNRHQSCDAAYHYMRCLMTSSPFEGALANLKRLFEKNRKKFRELPDSDPRDLPPDLQRPKDIKKFLIQFMYLVGILQPDSMPSTAEIAEVCQKVLHDFNLCMYYTQANGEQPIMPTIRGAEDDKEQYVPDDLVFKIVVMCLITIHRLQEKGSEQVSASIAFTLALFSHLLNHLNARIETALYDVEHPSSLIENQDREDPGHVDEINSDKESGREEDDQLTPQSTGTITPGQSQDALYGDNRAKNKEKKSKQRAIHKLRRRRRGNHSDDDLSEGEDSASSPSDFSDSDSDISEDGILASDSDSEDDSLMESQELASGFAAGDGTDAGVLGRPASNSPSEMNHGKSELKSGNNVSLTNHLKDMSNQLFAHNPSSSFLRRNIRLAPTFEAYAMDRAQAEAQSEGSRNGNGSKSCGNSTEDKNVSVITDDTEQPEDEKMETETETPEGAGDQVENKKGGLNRLITVLQEQGLMLSVKVFADWLMANPYIIETCAQSSQSLWSRLSVFLNQLPKETQINNEELCQSTAALCIINSAIQYNDWQQTIALTEDHAVFKLPLLKESQKHWQASYGEHVILTQADEALVRICCLRQFGHHLANLKSVNLFYDQEKNLFLGQSHGISDGEPTVQETATLADLAKAQMKMAEEEARRNQLMRDMAQLRLQSEVKQLEGSLEPKDQSSLSPYLVPDARVLSNHLNIIRQLAASARFIIIIPRVVIDTLDYIKKANQGARDAIKFLEKEFHKGNRYIRAQKENEVGKGIERKKIKGEEREVWCLYRILDCCRYFACQSSDYDPKGMVTILINYQPEESDSLSVRMRAAIKAANGEGINVEYAPDFHAKWKSQG
ncbi:nonsense-mediated mRNA decay factor SMG5-like [Ptychodera flava]|uniref:nonsense-mediated mRNA decay factor SMG5-like n=1 Tax=Ptychodera flava TaxID=63121 RepID=UPI00396A72CB